MTRTAPLAPNLLDAPVAPLSVQFILGFNANTGDGSLSPVTVDVSTNGVGQITGWDLQMNAGPIGGSPDTFGASSMSSGDNGYQLSTESDGNVSDAGLYTVSNNVGGSWMEAPEIGADSATAAPTLLCGWVLLSRGRRRLS